MMLRVLALSSKEQSQGHPRRLRVMLLMAVVLALAASGCAFIENSSVSGGGELGSQDSDSPVVSGTGRYVAFESSASNLVAGDTNNRVDIFVHDHLSGVTERVSVSTGGSQQFGHSFYPGISADGRFVAFWSQATNLVAGDTNGRYDVFVHDRVTGVTERVSVDSSETQSIGTLGIGFMRNPSLSSDGRYVAFEFDADDLVAGDTNGQEDIFVRDRVAGTTERVSLSNSGNQDIFPSFAASMSADGRYVAFQSFSTQFVAGDTNSKVDVFVRDRQDATTTRVSLGPVGAEGDEDSQRPAISGDGRYVAFQSDATNLLFTADTNGVADVFVHDRVQGATRLVSTDSTGGQANGASIRPSVSDDGQVISFVSDASDLVTGDTNTVRDVFVRTLNRTTRASVDQAGNQVGQASDVSSDTGVAETNGRALSGDGRYVVFHSESNALIPPGSISDQIFLRRALEPGPVVGGATIPRGTQALVVINGRWFEPTSTNAALLPGDDVAIVAVGVPMPNDTVYVTISVAPDAATGTRSLWLWNPGNWNVLSGVSALCNACITIT